MRYRTAIEIATQAATAAQAIDLAEAAPKRSTGEMLLAAAARPDLTEADVLRILNSDTVPRRMSATVLVHNPVTRLLAVVLASLTVGDAVRLARLDPDRLAGTVVALLHGIADDYDTRPGEAQEIVTTVASLLGPERIDAVFANLLDRDDDPEARILAAAHPLLPSIAFDALLDEAIAEPAVRQPLLSALARRPDLHRRPTQAEALYHAINRTRDDTFTTEDSTYLLHDLADNRSLPASVACLLASHPRRPVQNYLLTRSHVPAEALWAAARKGHLRALCTNAALERISPDDIIDLALTALETGDTGKDYLTEPQCARLRVFVAHTMRPDPTLLRRLLDVYLRDFDTTTIKFHDALLSEVLGIEPSKNRRKHNTPIDEALYAALSVHESPYARAFVVQRLLSVEDLALAVADPSPVVRRKCIYHPLLTIEMLSHLAADPDPDVARLAGEKFLRAMEPV